MAVWRFYIDRGGTFTDCLAIDPHGSVITAKVLSTPDAPLVAIRTVMGLGNHDRIPPCTIRMGTTIATNALLERRGARTLFVVTEGFKDVLAIGTQARPEIFSLHIRKPLPLYERVLETTLRADHLGQSPGSRTDDALYPALEQAHRDGIESVAIVVLNGHVAPHLERSLAESARQAGFRHISMSHECANEQGLLKRAQTTVIDAYLAPALRSYFDELGSSLAGSDLLVMQSSGNLAAPSELRGPRALLSGPAGGVVACEHLVRELGLQSAVGFDMGGTSTDVCRVEAHRLPRTYEMEINGATAVCPALDVHTVAAGGGSICAFDTGRFSVGPASAGALPGPACYGNADAAHLTVTDVNLLLGRLVAFNFPFPLDREAAEAKATELSSRVAASGIHLQRVDMLAGLLRIANYNMAEAIREVSLRRGFDVRNETLIVFGGAGGQHACAVARELGISKIVFPKYAGILSACGMACANHAIHLQQDTAGLVLDPESAPGLDERFQQWLAPQPALKLGRQIRQLDLRYVGSEARLTIDFCSDVAVMRAQFQSMHQRLFGYARPTHAIEVAALRVEVILEAATTAPFDIPQAGAARRGGAGRTTRMFTSDGWYSAVPVYDRAELSDDLEGPACILDQTGCFVVEPGWRVSVVSGHLTCIDTRCSAADADADPEARDDLAPDPVTLELMGQAFMGVARQMGVVLQRTASSTNIRERLDYSCAVFDRNADLVANAPHIPVHLGAMGETLKHVASVHDPRPGDVFVSNDPAHGGSHLPDITVVTPVFGQDGMLRYWVANRGHHSDVGGVTPGSMPAFSSSLEEEGVLLSALNVVSRGRLRDDLREILTRGPYPARNPEQNIRDLEAQIAANHLGASLLLDLETRFGRATVPRYMQHLQDHACRLTEAMIRALPAATLRFADRFDDGGELSVTLTRADERLQVRFAAPPQSDGNANAPRAVTVAAVLYVLRCLLGTRLPLNAGCLRPIDLDVPEPSLLSPEPSRAVCSGNVETSQRVVDVLLGALDAAAASQGTMNNVTFGNETFGYYETLAGGAGAGPNFPGADGVHTHMTNTRITDAEVLEARYPVRIRRFELRANSGGRGRFRGGNGCVREYEFLVPLTVTVVSERRHSDPFGLHGAQPGSRGVNSLNGTLLPNRCQFAVRAGDVLRIETPGGGGFGVTE